MKRKPIPAPAVLQKPPAFVELPFVRYMRSPDGILFADFSPSYRQQREKPGRPTEWGAAVSKMTATLFSCEAASYPAWE